MALNHCLFFQGDELVDKFREVVINYSKYRQAGLIETECSIKSVRILKAMNFNINATEFLQNIVFINLNMTDEEKVKRFSALSDLYAQVGCRRKAAFFHRVWNYKQARRFFAVLET